MPLINIGGVIYHYGIRGMEWGKRRFQNKDGSLTEAGKRRYAKSIADAGGTSTTSEKAKKVSKDIAADIVKSGMLGVEAEIETAMTLRGRLDDVKRIDQKCMESDEVKNALKRAYDDALAQYKEDYPEQFAEAVKANNGNTELLELHDPYFDIELFEREANYVDKAREDWYSKHDGTLNADSGSKASREYSAACRQITESLLGAYGDTPVTVDMGKYRLKTSLNYYMDEVVSILYSTPLDELRKDN